MKEVSTISKRKSRSRPQNRRQQPRPVNKGYGDAGASWHKKATKGFRAMSGSPKEDIDANNYTLRQRARMLYMAAPIATSAIRTNRTNVVGIGLQLKSRIDREALGMTQEAADAWQAQAEREFARWSENKRACDATGVNNFAAMQQLALSSWLVSGDVFAVVKQYEPTPLTPYSLRLHLIEADRVATPTTSGIITPMLLTTGKAANGNTIYDGVEVNDDGQIEAYHIRSTYPFELGSTTTTWARVQAYGERTGLPNILHVMESGHEPGKDAQAGAGQCQTGVRFYSAGLYALAGDAHHQCTGGGRRCLDSRAGAVPFRKRSGTAFADRAESPAADQPETKN